MRSSIFLMSAFAALSLSAKTYYWKGDINSDVTDLNLYRDDQYSTDPTAGNPATSFDDLDVNTTTNGQEIYFRDSTMAATLTKMQGMHPRTNSRIYIDIDQDWVVPAKMNMWANAYVIKRGKGNLILTSDSVIDSSSRHTDHNQNWIVEGGRVTFPQTMKGGNLYFYTSFAVSNNCSIVLPGSAQVVTASGSYAYPYVHYIMGEGDILYTNSVSDCRFQQSSYDENPVPFSGRIIDPYRKIEFRPTGIRLTGKDNSYRDNYILGYLGARILGSEENVNSSLGYGSDRTTFTGAKTIIHCLATAEDGPQVSTRRWWDYAGNTAGGTFTFDAGAYGGLTLYDGHINVRFGDIMKELILTGSNTVESVFSMPVCHVNKEATCLGHYYLTKRGSGTWRMSTRRDYERTRLTGVGVEEGTLKFDSIAERGKTCALGTATNLYGYAYLGLRANAPAEVAYAIRLGDPTNLAHVAGLVYSGETVASCKTRPIAISGAAMIGNESDKHIFWKGVSTVIPPDGKSAPATNPITLSGDSPVSTLSGLTRGEGTGPISLTKNGAGKWVIDGDVDVTEPIVVNAGTLGIRNYSYYTWYRFTITETVGGSATPSTKTNYGNRSMCSELGLFAADGSRLNPDLPVGRYEYDEVTRGTLPPNCAANGVGRADRSGESLALLFDGNGDTMWWNSMSAGYISQTNSAAWFPVVVHLADGTVPAAGFDLAYAYGINQSYVNCQPTHYTLEASANGEDYVTLLDNSLSLTKEDVWHYAQQTVTNDGTAVAGYLPIGDVTIPAANRHTVLATGISSLCVKGGATFEIYGTPVLVKNLVIDAEAGMGTLKNITFETSGTIDFTNLDFSAGSTTIETDLTLTQNWENLHNWAFTVDGEDVSTRYSLVISGSRLRISKRGGVISYE